MASSLPFSVACSPWSKNSLSSLATPPLELKQSQILSLGQRQKGWKARGHGPAISARQRPPVEELYRIFVEKNVTPERASELGVERWRRWESGDRSSFEWCWQVDEQVYIARGSLRVTPHDCPDAALFYAGDVVRFPKWFSATLETVGDYEQRYRFLAYGEGEG